MALVVDTDVASFLFKHDTRATLYTPHLSGQTLVASFQTLAELELWALSAGWGARRRRQLDQYLRHYVVEDSSPALCSQWAAVLNDSRTRGRPIATADAWIAATALLLQLPLVTHNDAHFINVPGLSVISEKQP